MPFRQLDPPTTLPRGQQTCVLRECSCGSVVYAQSCGEFHSSQARLGTWIAGLVSGPPASMSATLRPASTSRRAMTQPAEPAPTITWSNSANLPTSPPMPPSADVRAALSVALPFGGTALRSHCRSVALRFGGADAFGGIVPELRADGNRRGHNFTG